MFASLFITLLSLQICLDRRGFSVNAMDGQIGPKTRRALAAYCQAQKVPPLPNGEEASALKTLFSNENDIFVWHEVTAAEINSLVRLPTEPSNKAKLARLGYESILEMLAERGHVTQNTLKRLNPKVDWKRITVGTQILMPEVSPVATGEKAELVVVSLSNFLITAYDRNGRVLAVLPCSIARDKSKLPPTGEIRITTQIENPNYTYTPDHVPQGQKVARHIFAPGPNNPVGTVWLGLTLPGYGIHGTPSPETVGRAESHGCFRLANWNAEKLYELVKSGTRVRIEE